jgi:hypothetical protein
MWHEIGFVSEKKLSERAGSDLAGAEAPKKQEGQAVENRLPFLISR